MATPVRASTTAPAGRAVARSIGSMFFSVFGAAWLTLALYAFGRLGRPVFLLLLAVLAVALLLAVRLLHLAKPAAAREPSNPRRKQDDRTFAWINAGQGLAIFLLLFTLPRFGRSDLAIAAAVVVVGLHFLVMPPSYRYRSNFTLGICMAAWGLLSMSLFRGDRMIAFASLGAGLMLWALAAFALHTAGAILRRLAPPARPLN